ncbi:hypothetical protein SKA58_16813 [Sphingomonas sp. SKA58]|nr:hypothetical protein SKA58_16813 [Sphingomonas sp. SKA58]
MLIVLSLYKYRAENVMMLAGVPLSYAAANLAETMIQQSSLF